ncbi:hypothetical protein MNBD_GAMMA25-2153 [hydrothermal vent metagenome]|uniref:Cadherin domain-containing protein n=1 Tax=hydrothermal vent metagenome TaxID=652676 RepID=A0A3B1C4A9_9ZZZZ
MNVKQISYWVSGQQGFIKALTALSLSLLLAACGGGSNSDGDGLSARLNPDGSPANSSGNNGATGAGGTGTSTTPVANSNLTIDFSSPTQVNFGSAITINASTTNAQGAVSYALTGAPEGMLIDSASGEISWTPTGLNFGKDTQFNYRVSATDNAGTNTMVGSVTITDASIQPLVRSSARVPTKQNSIHIGDFNGDGDNEVLITDNVSLIYTLKWDGTLNNGQGDFYQEWVYPYSLGKQGYIDAIDAADVNGDGRLDIIVLNGNTVSVIDGATRSLMYFYEIADAVKGYAVFARNIDVDAAIEIVTLVSKGPAQEQLNVFTVPAGRNRTLNNDWTSPVDNYGSAMTIGNMDFADVQLEIATSAGYVFDGISFNDEYLAAKPRYGFGDQLVAADLDGDGVKEIVGLYSDSGIGEVEVFSLHEQSGLFGDLATVRDPDTTRCSIAAIDSDNNGVDEIYLGECVNSGTSDGELLDVYTATNRASFSGATLYRQATASFTSDRLFGGFVSLVIGDVDSDNDLEVVWGNKITSDKYNAITVMDLSTSLDAGEMVITRQNTNLALFDTAFTGAVDFLYAPGTRYATFMSNTSTAEKDFNSEESYNSAARFSFIDYDSGRVAISSRISRTNSITAGQKVIAADISGIGYEQLIFSGGFLALSSEFTSYELVDFGANLNHPRESVHGGWLPETAYTVDYGLEGNWSAVFDLANLDNDSDLEILGFMKNYLFSYETTLVFQNWQSIRIDGQGIDIKIEDVNDDGENDLVHLTDTGLYIRMRDNDPQHQVSSFYDTIFLFDNLFQGTTLTAMQIVDINADGQKEIIVSAKTDTGGTIYILDNTAAVLAEVAVDGEITDFQKGQMDNSVLAAWKTDGDADSIDTAYISEFAISSDMQTVTEIMRSPALLGAVSPHSMNYTDDNSRLLVGTRYGMYVTR